MKPMFERITSNQNPQIKNLIALQKNKERKKQSMFLVEGLKEIEKAIAAGYFSEAVYFCPEIIDPVIVENMFSLSMPEKMVQVSREIYNKLAYRNDSGGILALLKPKGHKLETVEISDKPLILVLEGIEKPGNIGAIYRTADAAGVSAILICDPTTDFYNPNTIRASLGCIFTVPTAVCTRQEAITWLHNKQIAIYTTHFGSAKPYHQQDFTKPTAIVLGAEATGVTSGWLDVSYANILIPMRGLADSMNVSTATAVLVFEACRQREFLF
jgi:RNA methyltransferase, TrmH family